MTIIWLFFILYVNILGPCKLCSYSLHNFMLSSLIPSLEGEIYSSALSLSSLSVYNEGPNLISLRNTSYSYRVSNCFGRSWVHKDSFWTEQQKVGLGHERNML